MAVEYFVKPKIARLTLSNNQYIDVKRRLNTGEQNAMFAKMAPNVSVQGQVNLDSASVLVQKVLTYLVGWSFTDGSTPVPMSPDMPEAARLAALNSLDPYDFAEIYQAIDAHEAAIDKEISELRKNKSGATESKATLASVAP